MLPSAHPTRIEVTGGITDQNVGGTMITETAVLPESSHEHWDLNWEERGYHVLTFKEGSVLTVPMLAEISAELRKLHTADEIKVIAVIGGLSDVCPDVSTEVAKSRSTSRVALLGQNHVDQVLSGFMLSDLRDSPIGKYVTTMDEALAHLGF